MVVAVVAAAEAQIAIPTAALVAAAVVGAQGVRAAGAVCPAAGHFLSISGIPTPT